MSTPLLPKKSIVGVLCGVMLFGGTSIAATKHKASKQTATKAHVQTTSHKQSSTRSKKASASDEDRAEVRSVSKKSRVTSSARVVKTSSKPRGQQAIDAERTVEIQSALIRAHYLNGEPSGVFDQDTREALTRFQSDNGWQTKIVPDSRALIKLGLGPSHEGLLNPESAVLSPHQLGAEHPMPGGSN